MENIRRRQELAENLTRVRTENVELRERLGIRSEIVGRSAAIRQVTDEIGRAAASNATVLIRGESGVGKELVARAVHWIGTGMAAFPIFFAVIENDLRRVLTYSMINQIGFMVVGIGIGSELAVNGAVAHAFADILFKALLFMSMGAVLLDRYRQGERAWRSVQIDALDDGILHGRCRVDFRLPTVQRVRYQVDDHERCCRGRTPGHLAGVAVCVCGGVSSRRHQDSFFRFLFSRLWHPL